MTDCTVMTWNVENLFLPGSPSGAATKAIYQRKLAHLAETIQGVAPDVIGLQEVGDPQALADLQQALGGAYSNSAISTHPDIRGIRVAVLARRPFANVQEYDTFPAGALSNVPGPDGHPSTSMGRGAVQVVARLAGNRRIRFVTAHLKSKLLSFPNGRRSPRDEDERARGAGFALLRRTAESVALRVYLNKPMIGDTLPTVLVGDMNDEPTAITTQLLQGPPDGAPGRRDKGDDVRLNNLAPWLPGKHHFSRMFKDSQELIDHIFVSQDLLPALRQVDSLVEGITSITEAVESRKNATVPDHPPLFARFDLP